jgi:aminoglycoside phosphotransferase (APT) family kinase protein
MRGMRTSDIDPALVQALILRAFPDDLPVIWQRTPDGVSARVYRLDRGNNTFFLRVAEEVGEDLAVDAALFERLRNEGIEVPQVVHVDRFPPPVDLSVLIMTAIDGESVASCIEEHQARRAVRAAGRDLARLNSFTVDGFGFISRAAVRWPNVGSFDGYREFVTSCLPDPWPGAITELFVAPEIKALEVIIANHVATPLKVGTLVHGDFDTTAIFHSKGRYTGLIDFGEVRGADSLFDLGHFLLHDRELLPWSLFEELLDGYREVSDVASDFQQAVRSSAVLLGLRQLGRWIAPERSWSPEHRLVRYRIKRIRELLGELRDA